MLASLLALTMAAVVAAPAHSSPHRAPAHCSRHTPRAVRPGEWRAARHALAPHGATAVRLCRYSGLNDDPAATLVRSTKRTRPRLVRRLVRYLDALPSAAGAYSCPADDASEIVVHLAYADGHRLRVDVGLRGCRIATNGRLAGRANHRLLHLVARLTG